MGNKLHRRHHHHHHHNSNSNSNDHDNKNQADEQNMRIMSNPIHGVDNGGGVGNQQRACAPINTSTYSVKDRLSNGNVVFNKLWKV